MWRLNALQRGGSSGAGDPLRTPTGGGSGSPPAGGPSALYTAALAVYDFENNANDTKGTYTLTAVNSPTYSTTGKAQGTYWATFTTNQQFTNTNTAFRFTDSYSVSFWFQGTEDMAYQTGLVGCYASGSAGGWEITLDSGGGNPYLRLVHAVDSTPTAVIWNTTLSSDTRYHVVVTWNNVSNEATAWVSTTSFGNIINGTTQSLSVTPGTNAGQTFRVGYNQGLDQYHEGNIDEVVLWTSVITSSDASAIFAARDGGTSWR